jgi:hypothetical protein
LLTALALGGVLAGCATDRERERTDPAPSTARGAWRGDTGLTGVGGTGTGGTGQAGAGTSAVGIDRQRTTGTGSLTNQLERRQE